MSRTATLVPEFAVKTCPWAQYSDDIYIYIYTHTPGVPESPVHFLKLYVVNARGAPLILIACFIDLKKYEELG